MLPVVCLIGQRKWCIDDICSLSRIRSNDISVHSVEEILVKLKSVNCSNICVVLGPIIKQTHFWKNAAIKPWHILISPNTSGTLSCLIEFKLPACQVWRITYIRHRAKKKLAKTVILNIFFIHFFKYFLCKVIFYFKFSRSVIDCIIKCLLGEYIIMIVNITVLYLQMLHCYINIL